MKYNQKGFGHIGLLAIIVILAVIAVTGWLVFKSKHGSSTASTDQQRTTTGIAVTAKPDFSDDRTLQSSEDQVSIDFSKCTPDVSRFYVAFGSTTVEITGKDSNDCLLNYGGEVENPEWDGKLTTSCKVPMSLGVQKFKKGQNGVDLSAIQKYC